MSSPGFFSEPEEMNYNYAFIDLGWSKFEIFLKLVNNFFFKS